MSKPQTYANHHRFDPAVHFFLLPLSLLGFFLAVYRLYKYPNFHQTVLLVLAIAFVILVLKVRQYALHVQDRLIRLEETLRMQRLLPDALRDRIGELAPRQFVGLRFAADAELADRVREALDERLDGEAIKKRIQSWRPDTFRV